MSNSFVRVPPDGAGKRIYTMEHVVSGNTVQVQANHLSDPDNPQYAAKVDSKGGLYTRFTDGDAILTAYNEQKISQEYIVGVYEHSHDAYNDLFYTLLLSGGSMEYQPEYSSVKLSVTDEPGSEAERTTNRYHYYQPGMSILTILVTSCGDSGKAGCIRRWGMYDDNNGLFFQLTGTTLGIVFRSSVTGSRVDTFIPQSQWNVDTLDGNGVSGFNLDVTMALQYFINISWPNNIFKFGIYGNDGEKIVCHKIQMAGVYPVPKIASMSLPVRFSIKNTDVTAGASDMREIMAVVKAENRDPQYTFWRFGDMGCVGKNITTNIPILTFKPKILLDSGIQNHINAYPETLSIFSSGASLKINVVSHDGGILTGDTWTLESVGGPLMGDSGATAINTNHEQFWIMTTFYIPKDTPTNIDLKPYFELNDEGILNSMGDDGNMIQGNISFVGTSLEGGTAIVTADFSYRALY